MTTFYLTRNALEAIASVANAASTDDVTLVLGQVNLHLTTERWTATATDRYIVAEVSAPLGEVVHTIPAEGVTWALNATDLVAAFKAAKRLVPNRDRALPGQLAITETEHGYEVSFQGAPVATIRKVDGNFPPVTRLFPEESKLSDIDTVAMNIGHLERLNKVLTPEVAGLPASDRKHRALHFKFTKSDMTSKPAPVYVTRARTDHGEGEMYRALIQPNHMLG